VLLSRIFFERGEATDEFIQAVVTQGLGAREAAPQTTA
jgi:hypothetical protein